MPRARLAGIVTRESEVSGKPSHSVELRCGEVWVFKKMLAAGLNGVTCRDFIGADLRHYIRNLKGKGVGIDFKWEADAFSRHKRWWLKSGHSFKEIPYSKKSKPSTAATVKASNPKILNSNQEGSE